MQQPNGRRFQRILILRGGALGDFLVLLPMLHALRAGFPGARIELIGNAAAARLAIDCRLLDAAHSQHDARWMPIYEGSGLPDELRAWVANFDLVLCFLPDSDGSIARSLREAGSFGESSASRVLLTTSHRPQAEAWRHFAGTLLSLGIEAAPIVPALSGFSSPRRNALAWHPGSGSPSKNVPATTWLEAIRPLMPRFGDGLDVIVGEAEMDRSAALREAIGDLPHRILANLPLDELARELAGARLFAGHDSGISHLAAAVGTPCVLAFGPTDPDIWTPHGSHVRTFHAQSLSEVLPAELSENILKALGNSPAESRTSP